MKQHTRSKSLASLGNDHYSAVSKNLDNLNLLYDQYRFVDKHEFLQAVRTSPPDIVIGDSPMELSLNLPLKT